MKQVSPSGRTMTEIESPPSQNLVPRAPRSNAIHPPGQTAFGYFSAKASRMTGSGMSTPSPSFLKLCFSKIRSAHVSTRTWGR